MAEYLAHKNYGLPSTFSLDENGAFRMVGGTAKADNSAQMMVQFIGWFRIFKQDFCVPILWLWQQPTGFVFQYKNFAKLKFAEVMEKYCPFIKPKAVDMPINPSDRREMTIDVQYSYKLDRAAQVRNVRFIRTL